MDDTVQVKAKEFRSDENAEKEGIGIHFDSPSSPITQEENIDDAEQEITEEGAEVEEEGNKGASQVGRQKGVGEWEEDELLSETLGMETDDDVEEDDEEIDEQEEEMEEEDFTSADELESTDGETDVELTSEGEENTTTISKRKVTDKIEVFTIGNKRYPRSAFLLNRGLEMADKKYSGNHKSTNIQCCTIRQSHDLLKCHGLHLSSRSILLGDKAYVRLNMMEESAGREDLLRHPDIGLTKKICYLPSLESTGNGDKVVGGLHDKNMCVDIHLRPGIVFVGTSSLHVAYYEEELVDTLGLKRLKEGMRKMISPSKSAGPGLSPRIATTPTSRIKKSGTDILVPEKEASQISSPSISCGSWCRTSRSHIATTCQYIHYSRGVNHYTEKAKVPGIPQPVLPDKQPKKPRNDDDWRGGRGGRGRGGRGAKKRGCRGGGAPRAKIPVPPELLQQPKAAELVPSQRKVKETAETKQKMNYVIPAATNTNNNSSRKGNSKGGTASAQTKEVGRDTGKELQDRVRSISTQKDEQVDVEMDRTLKRLLFMCLVLLVVVALMIVLRFFKAVLGF